MTSSGAGKLKRGEGVLLKTALACFLLAIVLMPFNLIENMPHWFGEFSVEGAFYPLMAGLLLLGIDFLKRRQLSIPHHISFKLFVLFLIWVLISGLMNWPAISNSFTRGRSGPNKLVLQYVVLLFTFSMSLGGYQIYTKLERDKMLSFVRYSVLISFILCGVYSLIEIFYFTGSGLSEKVLVNINSLYRTSTLLWPNLRSVCGEPSWFGSYFAFAYPWLLACIFFSKKRGLVYLILIIYSWLMVYLTFSRTAYLTLIAETLLFVVLIAITKAYRNQKRLYYALIVSAISIIAIVSYNSHLGSDKARETIVSLIDPNTTRQISNITRIGSAVTAINMGCDNPVFGVGLGQYAFFMPQYVPDWALESHEIRGYLDTNNTTMWVPAHCLFTRIYAETGAVGLLIWLGIWGSIAFSLLKRLYETKGKDDGQGLWLIIILICLAGVMLQGFNLGSFRFMGYWLLLPVLWVSLSQKEVCASNEIK